MRPRVLYRDVTHSTSGCVHRPQGMYRGNFTRERVPFWLIQYCLMDQSLQVLVAGPSTQWITQGDSRFLSKAQHKITTGSEPETIACGTEVL